MTIVLPYPTPQGANLADNDAGNAINSTPQGAPEGMATDTYNDVDRYGMTSIRQNTDNILAINAAIGTMAEQDASAVAITGGVIAQAVSVALSANSTQLGGLTLQQIYDAMLPVGHVQLVNAFTLPVAPAGVTATWALLPDSDGRVLRMTQASPPLTTGGSDNRTTSGTSLTSAQSPAHTHRVISNEDIATSNLPGASDPVARERSAGGDVNYRLTAGTGGASNVTQGTTSSVGDGDPHDHTVTVLPRYMELAAYVRTA